MSTNYICKSQNCLNCINCQDADMTLDGKLKIVCVLEMDYSNNPQLESCPEFVALGTPTDLMQDTSVREKEPEREVKNDLTLMPAVEREFDKDEIEDEELGEWTGEVINSQEVDFVWDREKMLLVPAGEGQEPEFRYTEFAAANVNRELMKMRSQHTQAMLQEAGDYLNSISEGLDNPDWVPTDGNESFDEEESDEDDDTETEDDWDDEDEAELDEELESAEDDEDDILSQDTEDGPVYDSKGNVLTPEQAQAIHEAALAKEEAKSAPKAKSQTSRRRRN